MKAIILAAGRGSRMKNLTEERPKCLVELHGKPLLDYQLDALRGAGITDIAIVTGYKNEMLSGYDLFKFHNSRWAETNMVSSLACAEEWLQAEPCIVSYSDIVYNSSAIVSLMKSTAALTVAYDPNWLRLWEKRFADPLIDAETFRIDAEGKILEIGGKPKTLKEVQGQYMGLLQFRPQGWAAMQKIRHTMPPLIRDNLDMTRTIQLMIEENFSINGLPIYEKWGEVDSFDDLKILNDINKS
jgi:choline kinase